MRFYENIFKPIPSIIFVLGIIIINPFHIPPDPVAQASEIPVMKPILVERTPEASKSSLKSVSVLTVGIHLSNGNVSYRCGLRNQTGALMRITNNPYTKTEKNFMLVESHKYLD